MIVMAIALALLAAAIVANGRHGPVVATLSAIVADQQEWTGTQVRVTGELLQFQDPGGQPYGVSEDAQHDRIGLRQIQPWLSLVGHQVVAVGTVAFDPGFGLYLANPHITP